MLPLFQQLCLSDPVICKNSSFLLDLKAKHQEFIQKPIKDAMANTPSSQQKPPLLVLLANPRGYCAGVERAIQMVEAVLRQREEPVYVRHEIVHNRHVVEELEAKGAVFVDEVSQIPSQAVAIFSAHGVARPVVKEAEARGLEFLDATCPLVNKVHNPTQHHHGQGRHVLLIGHKDHPEVIGTMGQVPVDAMTLVENIEQAETVNVADETSLAYVTQTTLSVDDAATIIEVLERRFPAMIAPNKADICYATTNRQDAVRAIAPKADALLVIGAPNSSNSNRLVEVARNYGCKKSVLIERASDIDWDDFEDVQTLGITAGASAPEVLVQEVIETLSMRFQLRIEDVTVRQEDVVFSLPKGLED